MEFKLIVKKLNNTLTKEEEAIFNDWFSKSDDHSMYFSQVEQAYQESPNVVDLQKGWEEVSGKINLQTLSNDKRGKKKSYWQYAAAVAAILILGTLPFILNKNEPAQNTPLVVEKETIQIGSDKATLTLEDGSKIMLKKGESYEANNLLSNGEELVYKDKAETKNKTIGHNVLTIPRGGQFFITLADGTKVWLNSESQLRYPVAFMNNMPREVELIYGEAYFEVSPSINHNGSHFMVATHEQKIDVLGTEFNIKAYKEDVVIATTLVEGKVLVKNGLTSENLTPGQQSRMNLETNQISVNQVDVYNEISWKSGFFSFKNKPLKEIMLVLSRWYDIEVNIDNNTVENVEFNGVFNKKQNLENILSIIENTNEAKFETVGNTIIVK